MQLLAPPLLATKLLAFDTSTDVMAIAVTDGTQTWQHVGAGGALTSAALIPAIMALLQQANLKLTDLDAIVFGRGPGSFTGLRTACSVAQGLAFGAGGLPVLPMDTLLAVAEEARFAHGATRVVALLDARMSEVYTARYEWLASSGSGADACWQAQTEVQLMRPEQLQLAAPWVLAGNVFNPDTGALKAQMPLDLPCVEALPTATAMLRLAPNMLAKGLGVAAELALPLYIRDKVAQTTAERAAIKLAA
ncbi:MAG: tRNA (adenosine(37)-N6)-threonylcarbamoyltransferase complex dimerization subunit type 1 TsaB [Burkholderiaceae bacterium]|nr:tRNA (adenosine(37)-N6)-threonylcarbamoyltransferase complex dimerization subunit type 1 TsaB [Burkholderiaceae bacterium]